MLTIRFESVIGNEREQVEITQVHGYHEGGYHLNINKRHRGSLHEINGDWVLYGNSEKDFAFDEVQILGEIINEYREAHPEKEYRRQG